MLMPKKIKFRKVQKGRKGGRSKGATELAFGDFGLKALEPIWLTAQQIEAMRVSISRKLKKFGKLYLRVFPDKPITKKPAETRMGKGKGGVEGWVCVVKRERIICEVSGLDAASAKEALIGASHKLPLKTKLIMKPGAGQAALGTSKGNAGVILKENTPVAVVESKFHAEPKPEAKETKVTSKTETKAVKGKETGATKDSGKTKKESGSKVGGK